jgi:hypothetical protein
LWSLFSALQPTIVPSASALLSSSQTIGSHGSIEYSPLGFTLKYGTDFENITVKNYQQISMPISHSFNLGAVSGGASFWMEGLDRHSGITPHSGSRCVGMETTTSERNEFNIDNIQNLVSPSTEYYVLEWLYLPVGWQIPATHWYSICGPFQGQSSPWLPVSEVHPNNWGGTNKIDLDYGGGPWTILDTVSGLPPIGEWFKLAYYVKLSTTQGIIKIWINDIEILTATGIDTWGSVGRAMLATTAKIYGGNGVGTLRLWVDDLAIYGAP